MFTACEAAVAFLKNQQSLNAGDPIFVLFDYVWIMFNDFPNGCLVFHVCAHNATQPHKQDIHQMDNRNAITV